MKNNIKLLTLTLSASLVVACQSGTKIPAANQNLKFNTTTGGTGSTCDGVPVWTVDATYSASGSSVVFNGKKYTNNWWTKGDNPEQQSGPANSGKVWTSGEDCGIAPPAPVVDPTPTPGTSPVATPTPTPTVIPTPTPPAPAGDHPKYPEHRGNYKGGSLVIGADNKLYKCKNDQLSAWCNSELGAWAYAPATGTAWQEAWDLVSEEPVVTPTPAPLPTTTPAPVEPTDVPPLPPVPPSGDKVLSIFWCGFGGDFCGQSTGDDVNPSATHVILAFANSNPDGSITVDSANWPTALIKSWQAKGKKVIISVGGQNGHWDPILDNPTNFVKSAKAILDKYNLDGLDLDIEGYHRPPQAFSLTINLLRNAIGNSKQIIVSPENVTVYQGVGAFSADKVGGAFNYMVPVIKASIDQIDYVQPQYYNNWYDTNVASADYLVNGYLQWLNKAGTHGTQPFDKSVYPGVPAHKLILGVLASTSAGMSAFYAQPSMVGDAFSILRSQHGVDVGGIMMWDSNWDKLNNYIVSNKSAELLGLKPLNVSSVKTSKPQKHIKHVKHAKVKTLNPTLHS